MSAMFIRPVEKYVEPGDAIEFSSDNEKECAIYVQRRTEKEADARGNDDDGI